MALFVAAALRFWHLGEAPPGLYRDEAYNGLDALELLQGNHALFFTANNGREPAYVYLTALSVALFGRTAFAVRLAAAVVGTLTTYLVYRLADAWFDRRTGLLAAWLWAVTLWPVHLSRIGLRPILLAPFLALLFWLGTIAYRRQRPWLWFAAGAAYGAAFYTYLPVRFTPLLLVLLLSYLLLSTPQGRERLWPGLLLFALSSAAILAPLALYAWQEPALVLGRTQQVSILNPQINQGDLWGTLLRQMGRAAGLFLWRGDTIVRHNPPGRPLFDLFMLFPFLLGVAWCVWRWRRPAAMALLLWVTVMLGPTILAEDTPHFLRVAGLLPAVLFLPAVGLSKFWDWPKLPGALRRGLVLFLAFGTLISTIADYVDYVRNPETAYLFEDAAQEMAQKINAESDGVAIYVDRRFWEGWPSIPFLVQSAEQITLFAPQPGLMPDVAPPAAIYAWPYEGLDLIPAALASPATVSVDLGGLARGDLEPSAYPLYVRYRAASGSPGPTVAHFGQAMALHDTQVSLLSPHRLQVDLFWSADSGAGAPLVAFVHVVAGDEIVAQDDRPLGQGYWPFTSWQIGQVVRDRHVIDLNKPYDITRYQIVVGLYNASTQVRLPVWSPAGSSAGDTWVLNVEPNTHEEN